MKLNAHSASCFDAFCIQRFIDEFDPRAATFQRHGSIIRGTPIQVQATLAEGKKYAIETHSNDTVGALRTKISKEANIPFERLRLIFQGKELHVDNDTLAKCRIANASCITITNSPTPIVKAAVPDSFPSKTLSTPENFDRLFMLLNLEEHIAQQAWDLILFLPTNERLRHALQDTTQATVDWNAILPPRNTFRLLYALQIVDSMLDASEATPEVLCDLPLSCTEDIESNRYSFTCRN